MALRFGHVRLEPSIEELRSTGDFVRFGNIPFDHFVLEKWNPDSPLSKNEQRDQLVKEYIDLGSYHRRPYVELPWLTGDLENIPDTIPTDLHTPFQRTMNSWGGGTFWIRTWYGNAETTEAEADTQYNTLGEKVFNEQYALMDINEHFVFQGKAKFEAATSDLKAFQAPDFVWRALCEIPDRICGGVPSVVGWFNRFGRMLEKGEEERFEVKEIPQDVPDVDRCQVLLVLVADQKACVEGKVLGIGINHRGQMLPGRVRWNANEAFQMEADWCDGQTLSENFNTDLDDEEIDMREGMDGWS